jgi:hypothetical protein
MFVEHTLLFVEEETAKLWHYPEEGFIYTSRAFEKAGKEEVQS